MKKIKNKNIFVWWIYIILSLSTNLLNYVSNIILWTYYSLFDFWRINLIFSLIFLIWIPTLIIQTFVSNHSNSKDEELIVFSKYFNNSIFWWFMIIVVNSLLFMFYEKVFKFDITLLTLLNIQVFISYPLSVIRWYIQGRKEFSILGINLFLEVVLKLIFIWISLYIWVRHIHILLALISFSSIISLLHWLYKIRTKKVCWDNIISNEIITKKSDFIKTFIWISWIYLFINLDMIFAWYFIPEKAWIYAIFSKLWLIIFMIWSIFTWMSLPYFVSEYFSWKDTKKIFTVFFSIVFFCWITLVAIFYIFPHVVIKFMFHKEISEYYLLPISSIWFFILTLSSYILNYFISIKKFIINYSVIIALTCFILLIILRTKNIEYLVYNQLISSCIFFLLSLSYLMYFKINKKAQKVLT